MKFKYNLSKDDYKKIIYEKNAQINIIYLIAMSVFFLIITSGLLLDNTLVIFITYLIYIAVMVLILFILNKVLTNLIVKLNEKNLGVKYGVYNCKLEKNNIIEELDDIKYEIKFDDIKKIKFQKNTVIIYSKSKPISLIFKKGLFEDETKFDELEKTLKNVKNNK